MRMLEIVVFAAWGIFTTCSSLPLSSNNDISSTVPSMHTQSNVLNDDNGQDSDGDVDELVSRFLSHICSQSGNMLPESNITRLFCEAYNNKLSDMDMESSRKITTPTEPQIMRQVIFVEIPSVEVVYRNPPKTPDTLVYVLPPEENHVYRIFDMRGEGDGVDGPRVHFLTGDGVDQQQIR